MTALNPADSAHAAPERLTSAQWRMMGLAIFGAGLDFFDFVVYAIFARYIADAFFPRTDPYVSIILTFLVYSIGFVVRPVGGMVLSHFGDKYGRRNVFIFAILGMSVVTIAIGFLPTYASWGLTATLALVLLRIVQGVSIGGETANAIAYIVETVPRRAGLVSGLLVCAANAGILLATFVNVVLQSFLSQSEMAFYGWRVPFLIGGGLGLLFAILRRALKETPEFLQIEDIAGKRQPILDLFRNFPGPLLCGIGTLAAVGVFPSLVFAFMPIYLTNILKYDPSVVAWAINGSLIVYSIATIAVAWIGDSVPREWLMRIGAALLLVFGLPFYQALVSRSIDLNILMALIGVAGAFVAAPFPAVIGDLFPTQVRFTGSALTLNLSTGLFGGLAPVVVSWLLKLTDWQPIPALYLMLGATLTLISSLWLPKYLGQILQRAPAPR